MCTGAVVVCVFSVFVEHFGRVLLFTSTLLRLVLGCLCNDLEGIFVYRRCTLVHFLLFMKHLGRQLLCIGVVLLLAWDVSGTSWRLFS